MLLGEVVEHGPTEAMFRTRETDGRATALRGGSDRADGTGASLGCHSGMV